MAKALAFTADKNQIATPWHIVEFLSELLDIKGKKLFDPTAGNGAMFAYSDRQCGIELDTKPYNELCDKYPNGDFINASLFESEDWIKAQNPDVVLMNPPFNAEKTKGLEFVRFTADAVGKGKLAAIVPTGCLGTGKKDIDRTKNELLQRHTLAAVLKLNNELFYPSAAVGVVAMIFDLGVPHHGKTFFAQFEEDGLVKDRTRGRLDTDGKWGDIKRLWLRLCEQKPTHQINNPDNNIPCIYKAITEKDDWAPASNIEINPDSLRPTYADFYKTVSDYIDFKIKNMGFHNFIVENKELLPPKQERLKRIKLLRDTLTDVILAMENGEDYADLKDMYVPKWLGHARIG